MSKPTKIYLYTIEQGPNWWLGFALAEDGFGLTSHISSTRAWSQHDLGLTSEVKHDIYRKYYPDGYELVWLDEPEKNPGFTEALALNKKNTKKERLNED